MASKLSLSLALVCALSLSLKETAAQSSGIIIPLYLWPSATSWKPLINAKKENPSVPVWAIVNPASGPGNSRLQEYVDGIKELVDNDIDVMGYVPTNYTERPESQVRADIDKWVTFYPDTVTGIFFDEMEYRKEKTKKVGKKKSAPNYYLDLHNYATDKKDISYTVGNPGTDTTPEYVDTVDTILIYESDKGFPTEKQYGDWHRNYPRENWGIIPFNIPKSQFDANKVKSAKQVVKWIYVTHDKLPNPWDEISSYLPELFKALKD